MIALNRALRDAFTDDETNARSPDFVWTPRQDEQAGGHTASLLPNPLKVATFAEARRTFERHSSFSRATAQVEKFEGDRKGPHPTQPHSRPYNVRKESPLLYILR